MAIRYWKWTKRATGYRVHARAANGNKTYVSTQSYSNKAQAFRDAEVHGMPAQLRGMPRNVEVRHLHPRP